MYWKQAKPLSVYCVIQTPLHREYEYACQARSQPVSLGGLHRPALRTRRQRRRGGEVWGRMLLSVIITPSLYVFFVVQSPPTGCLMVGGNADHIHRRDLYSAARPSGRNCLLNDAGLSAAAETLAGILKRVIVSPAFYPRFLEFLHVDIQSTGHTLSRPWSRQPNAVMSEIKCAQLHSELFRCRHNTRQSHGLFALAKILLFLICCFRDGGRW